MRANMGSFRWMAIGLGAWVGFLTPDPSAVAGTDGSSPEVIALGRALFQRSWKPNDIRCQNGDGLGPVYNATSCVACHNLGGSGGGGSQRHNVELVTPVASAATATGPVETRTTRLTEALRDQTGLRSFISSVLHKFGTSPDYRDWRTWLLRKTTFDGFFLGRSERNTPALFGAGLIDAIPDAVLEDQERRVFPDFPEIRGRVSRLKDGTIGRFGWKGQTATLDDFVRTACAAELGLEAPGHHQSPDPSNPKDVAAELDLSEDDCRALVAYVASLPAPVLVEPSQPVEARRMYAGGALFKTIGCATCHTPRLGRVSGLYSDLLLHDLGPANSGEGYYSSDGGGTSSPPLLVKGTNRPGAGDTPRIFGALSREWRTTPLWGLRDSAPYMHDGKAQTIEQAIARHGGQAEAVQRRYDALSGEQKIQLRKFLLSLAAPPNAEHLPPIPHRPRLTRSSGTSKDRRPPSRPLQAFHNSSGGNTGASWPRGAVVSLGTGDQQLVGGSTGAF